MNVLVTGGTGFLGGYVMAALEAAGHAPIAYDIAPPAPEMLAVAPSLDVASITNGAGQLRVGGVSSRDTSVTLTVRSSKPCAGSYALNTSASPRRAKSRGVDER